VKTISVENSNFASCVEDAQQERVIVTRRGKPVAVIIGLEGLDQEQIQLRHDEEFWKLIAARRK
jgi:prevent-host-death family protein